MKNKKENKVSKWVWIAIAIIVLGVGAYFLLASNGAGGLPLPPALPA